MLGSMLMVALTWGADMYGYQQGELWPRPKARFDHQDRIEMWLCIDCMYEAEGLDNDSAPDDDSEAACAQITARGSLFNDTYSDTDQHECQFCGHVMPTEDVVATGEDLDEHICPKCGEDGLRQRENGTDDFSWHTCDCCHSGLGGSRHRYAFWPNEKETTT